MRNFFLVSLFISCTVSGATINLKLGESITLQSNQKTTVTCGTSAVDCNDAVKRFRQRFDLCLSTNSTEQCINTVWMDFKRANPACTPEASDYCLEKCTDTHANDWCLNKCQ